MNKLNLTAGIRELVEGVVEKLSLELVHVEVVGAGKGRTVRIYIDQVKGITHEDCSRVSQAVEVVLDETELIGGPYILEVSSPGIERGLYALKDFEKFSGQTARLKTALAINGQRNFSGRILSVRDGDIIFDDKTNGVVEIPFSAVKKANLEFDIEAELKQAKKRRS